MDHQALKNTIKTYARKKLPLFISGAPGVGKSVVVKDTAKELAAAANKKFLEWADLSLEEKIALVSGADEAIKRGLPEKRAKELEANGFYLFAVLNMVENDLTDIKGVLALTETGEATHYADWRPPMLMVAMAKHNRHGMIFLDELTQTLPENLSPAFKLVLDHVAGDIKLSKNVSVMGAGNRVSDQSASFEMPKALRNRFGHVELEHPSNVKWAEWAMNASLDLRVVSFIRAYPDAFEHDESKDRSDNLTAYPSARSYHRMADLIAGEEEISQVGLLAESMVGKEKGITFKQYVKNSQEIDYDAIFKNPKSFKNFDPAIRWGAVSGLISMFKQNKKIAADLVRVCANIGDDVGLLIAQGMARTDSKVFASALSSQVGTDFVNKCLEYTSVSIK